MVVQKGLGYILAIIGLALVVVWAFEEIRTPLNEFIPESIPEMAYLIGGVVLVGLSVFLMRGTSGKTKHVHEVPIYQGQHIVGYRRHGKASHRKQKHR